MKPEPQNTLYAARILGPLLLTAGAVLALERSRLLAMAAAFGSDDPFSLLAGFLSLMFGLVILAFHRNWRSPTQLVVSLLGLLGLVRGAVLLFLPAVARGMAQQLSESPGILPLAGAVLALIGLWLTSVGWVGKTNA